MRSHNTYSSSKPQQQPNRWECQDGHHGDHHRSSNRRKVEAGSRVDIPAAADIKDFDTYACMAKRASEERNYLAMVDHCIIDTTNG